MDEAPFFFEGGEHSLFGVLHRPRAGAERQPAFVFCHPLAEEKLWAHRVFVAYARELAAKGYPVLRFDLAGNGDSDGDFSEVSLATVCTDVKHAILEVRRLTGAEEVSLLGLRLGATVASIVAEQTGGLHHLILWSPITDGERYMQDLLRVNVMTQMATYKEVRHERPSLVRSMEQGQTVNIDGYEMGWPLYSTVSAVSLDAVSHEFGGPCLIVQVDRQAKPAPDLQRLAASYRAATTKFAQEEAFWKEIARFYQDAPSLFGVTNEWLAIHEVCSDA